MDEKLFLLCFRFFGFHGVPHCRHSYFLLLVARASASAKWPTVIDSRDHELKNLTAIGRSRPLVYEPGHALLSVKSSTRFTVYDPSRLTLRISGCQFLDSLFGLQIPLKHPLQNVQVCWRMRQVC